MPEKEKFEGSHDVICLCFCLKFILSICQEDTDLTYFLNVIVYTNHCSLVTCPKCSIYMVFLSRNILEPFYIEYTDFMLKFT